MVCRIPENWGPCAAGPTSNGRASFGFLNQTEMPAAYAAADMLVLPSTGRETWNLVVGAGVRA